MIMKDDSDEVKTVKLTNYQIDNIIDELSRSQHDIYEFLNYEAIIKILKGTRIKKNSQSHLTDETGSSHNSERRIGETSHQRKKRKVIKW